MLYELILINEIEQRAKIIFLSVHAENDNKNATVRIATLSNGEK